MILAAAAPEAGPFLLELGLVVFGLALLARLGTALGLSPIPFYLLGSLLLGEGGVIPVAVSEEFIELGAVLGVVLLLFMLGLEYTGEELRDNLITGLPSGALDLVANFLPGLLAGFLLGWEPVTAVLLGGITYISSSGVISKTLNDLERLGNRETPAVLSILVLEDLVMAAYLPLLAVLLLGVGLAAGLASLAVAVGAAALVLFVALRYGEAMSRVLANRSNEVVMLSTLGLTLLVAGAAESVRVSAAVGAFLVGIALSGPVAERAHRLLSPLRDLFAATFFVFFGLQIDLSSLPPLAGAALALAVVTAATKMATGWWAARRIGAGVPGRLRAGGALVARGEFSIVIAGLGVAAGVEAPLGALAAGYVLVTALAGPFLARYADQWGEALLRGRGSRPLSP